KYLEKESRAKYVSDETFERLKCTEIFPGDILVSRLPEPVGRACIIPNKDERMITAVDCTICRPDEKKICKEYLCYFMQSNAYYTRLLGNVTGTTRKRISRKNLGNVELNVPPIEVQREIVNRLDRLVCVIESSQKELQLLDELIKARFVEMFGDPEFNNMGWKTEILGNLCSVGSSKRIYQNEQSTEGVPFLRISDLVNRMDTGKLTCDLYIPEQRFDELLEQELVPEEGDILLTARGTLGRCYIVQSEDKFYFQDGMISWLSDFSDSITALYISCLFEMPGFRKQIDGLQAGSTVAYLSISMTKKLLVMLPPIEVQKQFADFIEQVDKSKVAVQAALDKAQLLFDSLMQKYFG
ncbi:MAG: restriction endonuclease subunit S, partial [Tyzzerella sp.]|nr:restriction endonuclease subunit S [Tyzzerella sp.]